ncbi:DUF3040 domain-containing protein [Skermania sp. ID1734]|uniref:DUF3040 domain-containing protein n=1 Tax=Skermania sp. ID1734 TaxID=2597516 RepID=UPI00117D874A|nr:DUF3040 domain-containing protein [Skermania sp. ID1734]TSE01211.1 DUF3040 domain-containing protein [Skermania sp. ID1734]
MPLSEHEQRMLDQIESALYAEDPKFASSVRGGRLRGATSRRRLQAAALFVVGLVLLVAGVALPKVGGFPIISLIGFVVMFGAGVLLLLGGARDKARRGMPGARGHDSHGKPGKPGSGRARGPRRSGGFSARMEDRFRRRFEQD